jgi:hypothetical protein
LSLALALCACASSFRLASQLRLCRQPDALRPEDGAREGFTVDENEWWHYDYRDWPWYAIQNERFEGIAVK